MLSDLLVLGHELTLMIGDMVSLTQSHVLRVGEGGMIYHKSYWECAVFKRSRGCVLGRLDYWRPIWEF